MDKITHPAICVFCGASFGTDPIYRETARALGAGIAAMGARMVFGGGSPGLMGEVAKAAREGGTSVEGILPSFLRDVEPPLAVDDLFVRKQMMIDRSDAFIVLPGGLGTYDEFFEVLTAAQLRVHAKPIVLVNVMGYFDALDALVRDTVKKGFASEAVLTLYSLADDAPAALAQVRKALAP
jgi:uncharacterized protein (TIGR00730 family)